MLFLSIFNSEGFKFLFVRKFTRFYFHEAFTFDETILHNFNFKVLYFLFRTWLKLSQSLLISHLSEYCHCTFRSAVQLEHGSVFFKNYFPNKTDGVQFIHAGYKFCSYEFENKVSPSKFILKIVKII